MRRLALTLAVFLSLGSAMPSWAGERLQVPQLPGWKVISSAQDQAGEVSELIPENEAADTWTRRVTVQGFRNVPIGAGEFLEQVVQQTASVCDGATAGPVSLGKVNGLDAGTRTVACGTYKGDGRGTFTLYYVVRGREALYLVSRVWRGAPFNPSSMPISTGEMADWKAYVDAVGICDSKAPGCH